MSPNFELTAYALVALVQANIIDIDEARAILGVQSFIEQLQPKSKETK